MTQLCAELFSCMCDEHAMALKRALYLTLLTTPAVQGPVQNACTHSASVGQPVLDRPGASRHLDCGLLLKIAGRS